MGSLDGRVAVVTGAGRGIGRQHALLFAAEGARVVVNDPGGAVDGSGEDVNAAQAVVDEILALGGAAVASTESVTDWQGAQRIVQTALDTFGDLHVVVNNAGILRDRMLINMTESDFDSVVAVHLKGTFTVLRHAATYWRQQAKAGVIEDRSVINTSSGSGLEGNPGQTNYAAAKAGIAAITMVTAKELARYGVRVNCIAPVARTRLTEQTPGLKETLDAAAAEVESFDLLSPANISPLVAALACETSPFTGQTFSVVGTSVGIYQAWSVADDVHATSTWRVDDLLAAMETLPRWVAVRTQESVLTDLLEDVRGAS